MGWANWIILVLSGAMGVCSAVIGWTLLRQKGRARRLAGVGVLIGAAGLISVAIGSQWLDSEWFDWSLMIVVGGILVSEWAQYLERKSAGQASG